MTAQQIAQMLALLEAIDDKLDRISTLLTQIERTMPAMVEWAESRHSN
jgi:hypothetical protein